MKRILIILTTIFLIGCTEETPTMYTLTVSSNPTEGGTINPTSGEYEEGTEITIRVSPNTDYSFDKWEGDWNGSELPLILVMDSDKNLIGNFKLSDSDGDGINDDFDLCDNTRNGVPVDDNGCMLNPIYLDDNGVTIKSHEWGEVGDSGEVNGTTYTIVSIEELEEMIVNGDDLSKVCTSKIEVMNYLLYGNSNVDLEISNWDVSNVVTMESMFNNSLFSGDISNWDVSSVVDMNRMFTRSQFNGDISNWDVSSVTNMGLMFPLSQFNGDISNWDVSSVISMLYMFSGSQFNGDISNWDVSNVFTMESMFVDNLKFNQDLSNWNVSNVTTCVGFSFNTPQWTLPKPNFTNCNPN